MCVCVKKEKQESPAQVKSGALNPAKLFRKPSQPVEQFWQKYETSL